VSRVSTAVVAVVLGASASFGASVRDTYSRTGASASVLVDAVAAFATTGAVSEGLTLRAAGAVGMSAERLAAVDRAVLRGIQVGGFPGAAVVVGRRGYAVVKRGYGSLSWAGDSPAVDERTIYDLASLTKVVATTTAMMVLYDEGKVDLDAPVKDYLPAFSGGAKDRVTVRHLLTHRSGLPAGRDLWRVAGSPADARRMVLETPIYCRPGDCFEYSDIGADVLGFLVETVSGQRLDTFLQSRVFGPLGMSETFFRPPATLRHRIAPTELTPPRGYPIRGEVHDENAYALGGVAGHAGLFSTAADLSVFAQMMLNGGTYNGVRVVSDSAVRLFSRRAAGSRALGWDTCDGDGGCGSIMGRNAYGHTGFTGTSIWIDPDRDMFVVLLTNRVHASRARRPAKVISDVRADLADAAELAILDDPSGPLALPVALRIERPEARTSAVSRSSKSKKKSGRGSARSARGKSSRAAKAATTSRSKAKASKSARATTSRASAAKKGSTVKKASATKRTASASKAKASAKKSRSRAS
jgi:CubicO group peptidase (beta-lactamase class C family)